MVSNGTAETPPEDTLPNLLSRVFLRFNDFMDLADTPDIRRTQLMLLKIFPSLITVLHAAPETLFSNASLEAFVLDFSDAIRHREKLVVFDAQKLLFIGGIVQSAVDPVERANRREYQLTVVRKSVSLLLEWANGEWENKVTPSCSGQGEFTVSPTVTLCTQSRVNMRLWIAVVGDLVDRVHRLDHGSETKVELSTMVTAFIPRLLMIFSEIGSTGQVLQRDRYLPKNNGINPLSLS